METIRTSVSAFVNRIHERAVTNLEVMFVSSLFIAFIIFHRRNYRQSHRQEPAVIYRPLNERRNEIRVLSFDPQPTRSVSLSLDDLDREGKDVRGAPAGDLLECTIEHVSLDAMSIAWQRHQNSRDSLRWQDSFSSIIDDRDALINRQWSELPSSYFGDWSYLNLFRYEWGDFECLSYTWGNQTTRKKIRINGTITDVPENLETALRHLRALPETRVGMRYWVDALCINQDDVSEKSYQVKRMGEIYGRCRSVIAWLGRPGPFNTDELAVLVMKTILRYWTSFTTTAGIDMVLNREMAFCDYLGANEIWPSRQEWSAFSHFLSRPYWRRLWIIQELASNHNSTLFICGHHPITRSMIRAAVFLARYRSHIIDNMLEPGIGLRQTLQKRHFFIKSRHVEALTLLVSNTNLASGLDTLLDLCQTADSSDPRDKIYGLMGLFDNAISSRVKPDYRLSERQVFTHFAKTLIEATRRLDLLFCWSAPTIPDAWPSWVPRWTRAHDRYPFEWLNDRRAVKTRTSAFYSARILFNRILFVRGYLIDTIDGTASSGSDSDGVLQPQELGNLHSGYHIRHYKTTDGVSDALCRTLLMNHPLYKPAFNILAAGRMSSLQTQYQNVRTLSDSIREDTEIHGFRKWCRANREFVVFGKQLNEYISGPVANSTEATPSVNDDSENINLVVLSLSGRRLIITATGYLGLAPKASQTGDIIATVLGCSFPVIFRPCGDLYRVVGECYVDGLMDDEAMDLAIEGKISQRLIGII
ncbi:HET-domain-containing protein [Mytilinidion resinicola]|uniref:HET-domain-containing protein n=1 Tax=Mytilinidion resinicola TaxID=574789 RepID=A0A6A6Y0P9_9PEZI|nr:HET-domain-containing protein [Mytilinidion resinicola]KAF2801805.1 HET-domain-containing protein [Mytilinidion resinicola]